MKCRNLQSCKTTQTGQTHFSYLKGQCCIVSLCSLSQSLSVLLTRLPLCLHSKQKVSRNAGLHWTKGGSCTSKIHWYVFFTKTCTHLKDCCILGMWLVHSDHKLWSTEVPRCSLECATLTLLHTTLCADTLFYQIADVEMLFEKILNDYRQFYYHTDFSKDLKRG